MKDRKSLLFAIVAIGILVFSTIYRRENLFSVISAFVLLVWMVQLPGSLILVLTQNNSISLLRVLLFGHIIGLSFLPLLFYMLFYFHQWHFFLIAISVINFCLVLLSILNKKILFFKNWTSSFSIKKAEPFFFILMIVMIIVSVREFSQLLPFNFVIKSKRDLDAGILMSQVIGLKNYGYLNAMNFGGTPYNYHHFVYLLMALIVKFCNISVLSFYQVVFPLYSFFLFAVAAYYFLRTTQTIKVALIGTVTLLVMDDFYFLNLFSKLLFKQPFFFTIESIEWLHNSPSLVLSTGVMFILLAELTRIKNEKLISSVFIFLFVSIGTLACFKISCWVCLILGMLASSILHFRKLQKILLLSISALFAGIMVNKFLSGITSANFGAGSGSLQISLAYPVLRSGIIKNILHIQNEFFPFQVITFKSSIILLGSSIIYLIVIMGVRVQYFISFFKLRIWRLSFNETLIFFMISSGILISFLFTPNFAQHNTLYFLLNSIFLLTLVSTPGIYNFLNNGKRNSTKWIVSALVVVQITSGVLQIVQPFTNPFKHQSLSTGWFDAMNYIKNNTVPDALLAYNRHSMNVNHYKNDFNYVPVFSERRIVVGGMNYFPDYNLKKLKNDSLFFTSSAHDFKRIASELKIDFLVMDKWNGQKLGLTDTSILQLVFNNKQIDIYKIDH